ncbi:hypothetical protein TRICI_005947 [Trichomonascus ciferrii]|uniref:Major facilitator superfamily (MFS) profile domain-containing protein n=1 Tax=Trichomonascus ciferrii TaxID=44093 RepID=A0A642UUF2_9ASCO|nr:hypothetical protein TRICI_005947 [Trichomonascus ciferrii]
MTREDPATPVSTAPRPNKVEPVSGVKLALIVCPMYFGVFLGALDGTVVTALLSHIASDLHELSRVSWIATGYLVACAAFQPLYGKISDIFGRKEVLIFCNVMFAIGCLICGVSYNLEWLVAGRVVSGIGGGGIMSLSTIAVSDLVPLRLRGIFQGFGNISFGMGAGVGGVVGGILTDKYGWRFVFTIQVPFICLSIFLLSVFFKPGKRSTARSRAPSEEDPLLTDNTTEEPKEETRREKFRRIDVLGACTLVSTLLVLMFAIATAGDQFAWSSPVIIGLLVLSFLLACAFVYVELYIAKEPVIAIELFSNRTITASSFTNLFGTMAVYSILFYAPIFYASVFGMTPTAVGERLGGNFFGVAFGSFSSGILMAKTGKYYTLGCLSGILLILGSAIIVSITPESPVFLQYVSLFLTGTGYSGMLTVTLLALISAAHHDYQAITTSIQYAFRGIGSTLGVSIASSIFRNVLKTQLYENVHGEKADAIIKKVLDSVDAIRQIPIEYQPAVIASYNVASKVVLSTALAMGVLSVICSALMREHKLHSTIERD